MIASDSRLKLPFDLFQRYETVARIVNSLATAPGERSSVLDVGGLGRLADGGPFLPGRLFLPDHDVDVVDVLPASLDGYRQIEPEADLGEDAYDFVISCDVLEHVPPGGRADFLRRCAKAARRFVIVGAPFADPLVELAEQIFHEYHLRLAGAAQPMLREHLEYGLPDTTETRDTVDELGLEQIWLPSIQLYSWLSMMLLRHYFISMRDFAPLLEKVDRLYNSLAFEGDQQEPSYRRVVVGSIDGSSLAPVRGLLDEWQSAAASTRAPNHDRAGVANLLLHLLKLEAEAGREDLVDGEQLDRSRLWGEILPERPAELCFAATRDGLYRLDVLVATYAQRLSTGLELVLERQVGSGDWEEHARVSLPEGSLEDNQWHRFRFPPVFHSAGRLFRARIYAPGAKPGEAPTIYKGDDGTPTHRIYCQPLEAPVVRAAASANLAARLEAAEAKLREKESKSQKRLQEDRQEFLRRVEQLTNEVETQGGRLAEQAEQLQTRASEAAALERDLASSEKEVERLQGELAELRALDQSRASLRARLRTKEAEVAALESQSQAHQAAFEVAQEALEASKRRVSDLERELSSTRTRRDLELRSILLELGTVDGSDTASET